MSSGSASLPPWELGRTDGEWEVKAGSLGNLELYEFKLCPLYLLCDLEQGI